LLLFIILYIHIYTYAYLYKDITPLESIQADPYVAARRNIYINQVIDNQERDKIKKFAKSKRDTLRYLIYPH